MPFSFNKFLGSFFISPFHAVLVLLQSLSSYYWLVDANEITVRCTIIP